jgi:hypothetical protein
METASVNINGTSVGSTSSSPSPVLLASTTPTMGPTPPDNDRPTSSIPTITPTADQTPAASPLASSFGPVLTMSQSKPAQSPSPNSEQQSPSSPGTQGETDGVTASPPGSTSSPTIPPPEASPPASVTPVSTFSQASSPLESNPPGMTSSIFAGSSSDPRTGSASFSQGPVIAGSSTPASSSSLTGAIPLTTSAGSSNRSSNNIASIAAPAAVGAVLVPIIALFFWWWKRRSSFRNAYNRRNRSNDTEMSNLGESAQGSSQEPKKAIVEHGHDGAGTVTFTRSRTPEQGEIKAWPVDSTFTAGILPGLASSSPTGNSFASPPPYFKGEGRSDSPSHYLADSNEPRAVTSSEKVEEPARRPVSSHRQSSSKRHGSVRGADIDWPLPSPFRDLNANQEVQGIPPVLIVEGVRPGSSKQQPSEPMPSPMTTLEQREFVSGPASPSPVFSRPNRRPSPKPSERSVSRQSPFGDEHADDSESEYSVSVRDKRPRSSMLSVPEGKQINDDGISEMSVSSNRSNRKSRLNHRASDELSVVSSLNDVDDITGPHEVGTGRRRSLVNALPNMDNV